MRYFLALITFKSIDGIPLDFSDYCAGVGMWICIVTSITFMTLAINLWL